MPTGFAEHIALIQRLPAVALEAAKPAVTAACTVIYDRSQELVPVDTGALKASGQVTAPVVIGDTVTAAVAYGDAKVNYAGYQEFGTSRMHAQAFLTPAVMESIPELPTVMGVPFAAALRGML